MIDFGLGKLRLWSEAAACAGLFMTQSAQTHPATYTLNDVMQASFASDMLAAPTGAAVAWVFNAKGCSNIWVADPSHGAKARQITPYTEDDGFDIGELGVAALASYLPARRATKVNPIVALRES